VCVKKDFDDLYNKIIDGDEPRELTVIHGGVVEVTYQPVRTVRDLTVTEHPFITTQPPQPEQQEAAAATATQEGTQVHSSPCLAGNSYNFKQLVFQNYYYYYYYYYCYYYNCFTAPWTLFRTTRMTELVPKR